MGSPGGVRWAWRNAVGRPDPGRLHPIRWLRRSTGRASVPHPCRLDSRPRRPVTLPAVPPSGSRGTPDRPRSDARARTVGLRRERSRDRTGQEGAARLHTGRHRGGAAPANPGCRRSLDLVAVRRLPPRHPGALRADGLRELSSDGRRHRPAGRRRSPGLGGAVDQIRGSLAAVRRDSRTGRQGGDSSPPGDLRGPDHPRTHHGAAGVDPRRGRAGGRSAVARADPRSVEDGRRRGRRPLRHPRHDGVRRTRLGFAGAAQPQTLHLRTRRARHRRGRRDLHGRAPPHAHRRRRGSGGLRGRRRLGDSAHRRHRRAHGDDDPAATTSTSRVAGTCTS